MPGVLAFYDHTSIPGLNSTTGNVTLPSGASVNEEIFITKHSYYAGQAVGIIVADTYEHANRKFLGRKIKFLFQNPNRVMGKFCAFN